MVPRRHTTPTTWSTGYWSCSRWAAHSSWLGGAGSGETTTTSAPSPSRVPDHPRRAHRPLVKGSRSRDGPSRGTALRYAAGGRGRPGDCLDVRLSSSPAPARCHRGDMLLATFIRLVALEDCQFHCGRSTGASHQLASAPHRRTLRTVRDPPARRGQSSPHHPRWKSALEKCGGVSAALVTIAELAGLVIVFRCGGSTSSNQPEDRACTATAIERSDGVASASMASSQPSQGLGAGLEVAVEQTGHQVEVSPIAVSYAVAIPVSIVPRAAVECGTRR